MKLKNIGAYLLLSCLVLSCKDKIRNRAELYSYIQDTDRGLLVKKENNGITVAMSYIASKLISDRQEGSGKMKYLYFRLVYQIQEKDMLSKVGEGSYSVLFSRLSFKLADYLMVSSGGKKEQIADYQFSPMFGATNNTELIVAIDPEKLADKNEFAFQLKDIGLGLPVYEFKFEHAAINRLENLTNNLEIQD